MRNLEFRALEIFKPHQFTADYAEALIEFIREAKSNTLATKKDLTDLQLILTKDIRNVKLKIEQTSNNNIKWFVGVILGQTGLIFALLKLFDKI